MKSHQWALLVALIVLVVAGVWVLGHRAEAPTKTTATPQEVGSASYTCAGGKKIAATFYEGLIVQPPSTDQPPVPNGSAQVVLSDGRTVTLLQTISADGARYANSDESIIFWTKGTGAFLQEHDQQTFTDCVQSLIATDYKNATYTIEGQSVTLMNGRAETMIDASSTEKTVTQYFGNDATGDLNGDSMPDTGFIITQTSGGSGTFYYVFVALKTADGYQGTNAVLLGDRIAPQSTEIQNGQLIVNYADRKPDEPMTAQPSVGMSKHLIIKGATLQEVPAQHAAGVGQHCGGNMSTAATCTAGYHCAPTPGSHLPFGDVGGTCVAD